MAARNFSNLCRELFCNELFIKGKLLIDSDCNINDSNVVTVTDMCVNERLVVKGNCFVVFGNISVSELFANAISEKITTDIVCEKDSGKGIHVIGNVCLSDELAVDAIQEKHLQNRVCIKSNVDANVVGIKVGTNETCVENNFKLNFPFANCTLLFSNVDLVGGNEANGFIDFLFECDGNVASKIVCFDGNIDLDPVFDVLETNTIVVNDFAKINNVCANLLTVTENANILGNLNLFGNIDILEKYVGNLQGNFCSDTTIQGDANASQNVNIGLDATFKGPKANVAGNLQYDGNLVNQDLTIVGNICVGNGETIAIKSNIVEFTSNVFGWTVPDNVSKLFLNLIGGGGGGAAALNANQISALAGMGIFCAGGGGGGGGSGDIISNYALNVVPGDTFDIIVGNGGLGGPPNSGNNGSNGQCTIVMGNSGTVAGFELVAFGGQRGFNSGNCFGGKGGDGYYGGGGGAGTLEVFGGVFLRPGGSGGQGSILDGQDGATGSFVGSAGGDGGTGIGMGGAANADCPQCAGGGGGGGGGGKGGDAGDIAGTAGEDGGNALPFTGAGGGGAGSSITVSDPPRRGGNGGNGIVRIELGF